MREALSEMPFSGPNTRLALIIFKGTTIWTGEFGFETKSFQTLTLYRGPVAEREVLMNVPIRICDPDFFILAVDRQERGMTSIFSN